MTRTIREMIRADAGEDRIAAHAFEESGLSTLREDGAKKVLQGQTTIEEVRRVTYLGDIG